MVGASILDFAVTDVCSQTAFNRRSIAYFVCSFCSFWHDEWYGGLSMIVWRSMTWPQGLGGYQIRSPIIRLLCSMLHAACKRLLDSQDWLDEGARIYLNDEEPTDEESLEILHTPGHTPDSISLWLRWFVLVIGIKRVLQCPVAVLDTVNRCKWVWHGVEIQELGPRGPQVSVPFLSLTIHFGTPISPSRSWNRNILKCIVGTT